MSISAIVNTWNEEANIGRALQSLSGVADETVVVDMHSSDATVEIAKKLGARVCYHEYTQFVEPARNYAIDQAKGDWILVLDADEEIPPSLGIAIKEARGGDYYRLPRKNIIFNRWIRHSGWWPDYQVRFFRRQAVTWSPQIHSIPITVGQGQDLPADEGHAIIHHHYSTVHEFLEKLNRYTSIQSRELTDKFTPGMPFKSGRREFFSRLYAWEGMRDGYHGISLSLLQAVSELVKSLKSWEQAGFKEYGEAETVRVLEQAVAEFIADYNYWHYLYKSKKTRGIVSWLYRIRAKIRI